MAKNTIRDSKQSTKFVNEPSVSIITVCYNSAATIADTIASVNQQTWRNVQHVIIDGASSDGTQAIIERNAKRDVLFVSEADLGIYDAMNKGILAATGDIVAILNADDFYAHAKIVEHAVERMGDHDAIFADIAFLNASIPGKFTRRYHSDRFTPKRLGIGIMPAHPGMFIRREVHAKYGLYDQSFEIAADFEFIARVFGLHGCSYDFLPEVAVLMRGGGASTSGWKSKLTINREVVRACRMNQISANAITVMGKYPFKLYELLSARILN